MYARALGAILWFLVPAAGMVVDFTTPAYDATGDTGLHVPILPRVFVMVPGTEIVFLAQYDYNGMTAADPSVSWPVTGVAAPDDAWWADDPTGGLGKTTATFTQYGAPTAANSPFCPDGSWGDVTSGCMASVWSDNATKYYQTSDTSVMNIGTSDMTVLMFARAGPDPSADATWVSTRGGVDNIGWQLYRWNAGSGNYCYIDDGPTLQLAGGVASAWPANAWIPVWMVVDFDGNFKCCDLGGCGAPAAVPGAETAINNSDGFRVLANTKGNVAAVLMWQSILSDADIATVVKHFLGILDEKGATPTYTSTGPNCCWVDGQIECYDDDFPMLGCEIPPGATGAGTPSAGYYSGLSLTNSITYSRVQSSGWTENGTVLTNCTQSSTPFRDGRQTCLLTDNDAGTKEFLYQQVDITALSAGAKVQVCVYARDASGTVLDLQVYEHTNAGGVCTATVSDFTAATISTTWTQYGWTHTVSDGDCQYDLFRIAPADLADVANTGTAQMIAQVFLNQSWCPPIYIETAASAVGAGNDRLYYDVSSSGVIDGTGKLNLPSHVKFDFTHVAPVTAGLSSTIFKLRDTATATDYWELQLSGSTLQAKARSTEEGAERTIWTLSWTPTSGTTYSFDWQVGTTSASTVLIIDGAQKTLTAGTAIGSPPDSLDRLEVLNTGGGGQSAQIIENLEVTR